MRHKRDAKAPPHRCAVYIYIAYLVVCDYKRCIYGCLTASERETFISCLLRPSFSEHVQPKRLSSRLQSVIIGQFLLSYRDICRKADGRLASPSCGTLQLNTCIRVFWRSWYFLRSSRNFRRVMHPDLSTVFTKSHCDIYRLHVPHSYCLIILSVSNSRCLTNCSRTADYTHCHLSPMNLQVFVRGLELW